MKKYTILVIILFLSLNLLGLTLDLEKCRNLALENSEEIQAAKEELNEAKYKKNEMLTNFLPKFSFSATYLHKNDPLSMTLEGGYLPTFTPNSQTGELEPNYLINPQTGEPVIGADGNPVFQEYAFFPDKEFELSLEESYTAGLKVKQPIFMGGKIYNGWKIAEYAAEIQKLKLKFQKENIIFKTDKAYWKYISVQEKLNLAKKYEEMLTELVRQLKDAEEVGLIHKNKLMQAQVELNNAKLKHQKAKHGLELSKLALFRIIGLNWDTEITSSDSIQIDLENQLPDSVISKRTDFKMLQIKNKIYRKKVHLQYAEFLPEIGLQASYNKTQYELNSDIKTEDDYSIIANFELPIFEWGENYSKAKQAASKEKAVNINFNKNKENMRLQIKKFEFDFEDSKLRLKLAKSSINQAEENLKIAQDQYDLEQITLSELLEAQTKWNEAASELTDAKIDFKLAYTNYLKAVGELEIW